MNQIEARKARTQQALIDAFGELFIERGYEAIRVGEIVARAGVARSTFYEHYRSKNALFAHSIQHMTARIATIADVKTSAVELVPLFEHLWQNRSKSRRLHNATGRRQVIRVLANLLATQLAALASVRVDSNQARVSAYVLAEALVGSIVAWQSGEIDCGPSEFAHHLHRIARAVAIAVGRSAPG